MKKIWTYVKHHVQTDFSSFHYGFVSLFLCCCIYTNFQLDFEDSFLDQQTGIIKFIYYYLTNLVAYLVPVFSYVVFCRQPAVFRSREFWLKSLLALALLSVDRCTFFLHEVVDGLLHIKLQMLGKKLYNQLSEVFTTLLPLFLLYWKYDRDKQHVYGLLPKRLDVRPYFMLLLIMLPLIISASFLPSFLRQYPMYLSTSAHLYLNIPEWITVVVYEICYGIGFLCTEFFFRGFLVIGMISVLGRAAIVPMASVYCFLHFGKPMGEAISSIFGGYILGVIAYETRSIWGGVIVHVGIAWSMELVAFIQKAITDSD